jgi:DNA (cytosine-5)-methyltransferase 1
MTNKLSVISLFTGVGGLDFGFEAAGFETRVALEMDDACCRSLRASRTWPIIEADLNQTSTRQILKGANLKVGSVDILIGGPPCQPFSKSGWWKSGDTLRLDDPRASTLSGYLRVLRECRPKAFLLENVEGLAFGGKDEGLRLLLSEVEQINSASRTSYKPVIATLNAADFGVPQTRTRVFVIACREGIVFKVPRPTHRDALTPENLGGGEVWRTAWDAIGNMPEPEDSDLGLTGKWADLLPSIPEGQNYLWHTERQGGAPLFGWRRRYWSFLLKLAKNRPAWTIQAQPGPATGPFHWKNRKLSVEEMARLQTFPKNVVIHGARGDLQRQVGNAVPSLLAEILAREIRTQFFGGSRSRGNPKLLPPRSHFVPPQESCAPVPQKYLGLIGKHAPHPGTGRGFSYQDVAGKESTGQRKLLDSAVEML